MSSIPVKAAETKGEDSRVCEIQYDFGDNLTEAVSLFGEEVVYSAFRSAAKIQAQSNMRRMMKVGFPDDEVQARMNEWKVGISLSVVDETATVESIARKAANMSTDQLKDLIEKMKKEMAEKLTPETPPPPPPMP